MAKLYVRSTLRQEATNRRLITMDEERAYHRLRSDCSTELMQLQITKMQARQQATAASCSQSPNSPSPDVDLKDDMNPEEDDAKVAEGEGSGRRWVGWDV